MTVLSFIILWKLISTLFMVSPGLARHKLYFMNTQDRQGSSFFSSEILSSIAPPYQSSNYPSTYKRSRTPFKFSRNVGTDVKRQQECVVSRVFC